jgi:MFS family permease
VLVTLLVVLITVLFGLGDPGVGILTAAIGIGGVVGLVGGLALRRSTSLAYAVALAAWGLPIAVIGIAPGVAVAVGALAVVGLSNALLDIIGFTLLQRGCRNEERGPVFAIFEGAVGIGATIGSLAAPTLIDAVGLRPALVATGLVLPVAAVLIGFLLNQSRAIELSRRPQSTGSAMCRRSGCCR